ncbi:hypothetical protein P152DRAFT_408080 [Eremomyces bilateralis CBS 781.70]|uniref:Transglycosylase SLT domain-containing protein n=1 Tax=Eremomyces bilateralis CBS 781.70 TaxID=1392243 RepID=A0A6G1GHT0_9PEZI|nr:uncharacterized protein P152DRAFT_408080 [Eremomyces bilateralis CBS 781.70]KAF1817451.1 hypothetical protein P152DRAFT_408080 [Eremomyces bilateralis CBS 781.70]
MHSFPSLAFALFTVSSSALPLLSNLAFYTLPRRSPAYGGVSRVVNTASSRWYSADTYSGASWGGTYQYQCFGGDISKYPTLHQWLSFDNLLQINRPALALTNTEDQIGYIRDGIIAVAEESIVDPRVILVVMMQESTGRANSPCTGGHNCGLMQANRGSTSFDSSQPRQSIKQMIAEGIQGTTEGPGYVQYLNNDASYSYTNNRWPNNPFAAARCYNSGRIDPSGNLDIASYGSMRSYVNDVANRLLGWTGHDTGSAQAQCGLS